MIEPPSPNYIGIIIAFLSIVPIFYLIIQSLNDKDYTYKIIISGLISGTFLTLGISSFYLDNTGNNYKESVFEEINNLTCDQMQKSYNEYMAINYSNDFTDRIKSKYLFECVSEKTDLTWLK